MHVAIAEHQSELAAVCRRYGVTRLAVFGSAARGRDFDTARSDADFLVTFEPVARNDLKVFAEVKEALEAVLGRTVELVEHEAVEKSRNHIRRHRILTEAELVYG